MIDVRIRKIYLRFETEYMGKIQKLTQLFIIIGIIFVVNVIANYYYTSADLTEEKRYTLSPSTYDVVEELPDNLFIKVLLDGDFPAGFMRLQNATSELLDDLKDINPNIQYIFEDPLEGTVQDIKSRREILAK
ncbi:MAG: ABC-2 type transport system permease protein, partial [Saprospiraceae bacterium]